MTTRSYSQERVSLHGSTSASVARLSIHGMSASSRCSVMLGDRAFTIGRSPGSDLMLVGESVSKHHASIQRTKTGFFLVDDSSRNGTFINGVRVARRLLEHGDVIHAGENELVFEVINVATKRDAPSAAADTRMDKNFRAMRDLFEVLSMRAVDAHFQPVKDVRTGEIAGYEALSRPQSTCATISNITELISVAEHAGHVVRLSELLIDVAVAAAVQLPPGLMVFLNVHPEHLDPKRLRASIDRISALVVLGFHPVIEINESGVMEIANVLEIREMLHSNNIMMAYDDVGVGMSRLVQLAEATPDIVKLDRSVVESINTSPRRQALMRSLANYAHDHGARVVAECVETQAEYDTCVEYGCDFVQGWYIGRPEPVTTWIKSVAVG